MSERDIATEGLDRLPRDNYEIASEIGHPDAILLRSYKMHDMHIPDTLRAVGRAGAGTNNIPVDKMTEKGIPVFNAPGANANAVKELVIAGMLMASRNIAQAWDYASNLEGDDAQIGKDVERRLLLRLKPARKKYRKPLLPMLRLLRKERKLKFKKRAKQPLRR